MNTSISARGPAQGSSPSSPNAAPSSSPSASLERLQEQWLKVRMADHLRLMEDNQRVLDTATADDQALRRQRHAFRNLELQQLGGAPADGPAFAAAEDDMGISIDSPVSTNHYYPPPPPARPSAAPWVAAGLATVVAAALGGSYLGSLWNRPAPPANTRIENTEGFLIELQQANGK